MGSFIVNPSFGFLAILWTCLPLIWLCAIGASSLFTYERGRSAWLGVFLGAAFGPLGVIVACLVPDSHRERRLIPNDVAWQRPVTSVYADESPVAPPPATPTPPPVLRRAAPLR
jgi:hypothetical protein